MAKKQKWSAQVDNKQLNKKLSIYLCMCIGKHTYIGMYVMKYISGKVS